ncbi:hypothetical protein V8G54_015575 [Vigna mungo]|uniref:Uncharacterized protein n=1 Tax=Vigna mungo TaxID=3915 RepID=A0AAQ3NJP8_VIGMU
MPYSKPLIHSSQERLPLVVTPCFLLVVLLREGNSYVEKETEMEIRNEVRANAGWWGQEGTAAIARAIFANGGWWVLGFGQLSEAMDPEGTYVSHCLCLSKSLSWKFLHWFLIIVFVYSSYHLGWSNGEWLTGSTGSVTVDGYGVLGVHMVGGGLVLVTVDGNLEVHVSAIVFLYARAIIDRWDIMMIIMMIELGMQTVGGGQLRKQWMGNLEMKCVQGVQMVGGGQVSVTVDRNLVGRCFGLHVSATLFVYARAMIDCWCANGGVVGTTVDGVLTMLVEWEILEVIEPWCLPEHEQHLIVEPYDDLAYYGFLNQYFATLDDDQGYYGGCFSISILVPEFFYSSYGLGSFIFPNFLNGWGLGVSVATQIDYCFSEFMGFTRKLRNEMCAGCANGGWFAGLVTWMEIREVHVSAMVFVYARAIIDCGIIMMMI